VKTRQVVGKCVYSGNLWLKPYTKADTTINFHKTHSEMVLKGAVELLKDR
jgi:hypothetical protein